MPLATFLSWSDVDPAVREFDSSLARTAALDVLTALGDDLRKSRAKITNDQIEGQLEAALLAAYGPWIAGWNWAASEPGGGGPVRAWCCDTHSILRADDKLRDVGMLPTVDRVVAAATEWRDWLEQLARVFGELR
ncbi:MAG TPA: hypothetical protein VIV11_33440, partial [Kofleriaceae bacterium]